MLLKARCFGQDVGHITLWLMKSYREENLGTVTVPRHRRRVNMRFLRCFGGGVALLALLTISSLFSAGAQAAGFTSSAGQPTPKHDMSHPAPATLPCPGAPRSGTGAQAVVSCKSSSTRQATGGITPKANNPRGMCINGVGYRQNENGASGWSATDQGLTAYVEYWWCPVTSAYSGQYPNGINWSWGTVKPASGCATVSVWNSIRSCTNLHHRLWS